MYTFAHLVPVAPRSLVPLASGIILPATVASPIATVGLPVNPVALPLNVVADNVFEFGLYVRLVSVLTSSVPVAVSTNVIKNVAFVVFVARRSTFAASTFVSADPSTAEHVPVS